MEAWARESWNSGVGEGEDCDAEAVVVVVEVVVCGGSGVGEMTSSRHCGVVEVVDLRRVVGPVGVLIVEGLSEAEGATDWKAWMGSASKNSCAKMNGVLSVSGRCLVPEVDLRMKSVEGLLLGTNRMSSHHITGAWKYLL